MIQLYSTPSAETDRRKYSYENWIKRPEERTRLDALLRCLSRPEALAEARRVQIVTWRGIMTKYALYVYSGHRTMSDKHYRLLIAPYETRDGWDLNVMLVDGKLFLEEHQSPDRLIDK